MDRGSLPPLEDDFTRALLRSAEGDEPSHAAYAKAAAALGVSVGLGVTALMPVPAALAAGAAGLAGAARWSSSVVARLAAFGVSGVLLVAGGVLWLHVHAAGGTSVSSARVPLARPAPAAAHVAQSVQVGPRLPVPNPVSSALLEGPAAPVAGAALRAPASASSAVVHRPRALGAAPRAAVGSSLAEQVQSLDRARVALSSADPGAALREIAHYRATWPKGVFLTEASVLEIEALAARGERSLAATRASAFVAAHPDSPQADRLRALIPADQR